MSTFMATYPVPGNPLRAGTRRPACRSGAEPVVELLVPPGHPGERKPIRNSPQGSGAEGCPQPAFLRQPANGAGERPRVVGRHQETILLVRDDLGNPADGG